MVNKNAAFVNMWCTQSLRTLRDMKGSRAHGNLRFEVDDYDDGTGATRIRTTLYSYAEPIARRFDTDTKSLVEKVWVVARKFSRTTSRHVSYVVHHFPTSWVVFSDRCPETYDAMLVAQDAMLEQQPAHPKSLFEEKP